MALRIDDVDLQRDRRLVERFQEGDATAFDMLYRRYFARLQRFCLKRVGDAHEAEEIAQEAFTRALRALPDLGGERRFYPWMTVIAGRLCVDHHRRRSRSEPTAVVDLGAIEGGQEAIVDRADEGFLATALDRLAPRHREVLELRETNGWTYHEIASHYDVPVGTVEALLFRARKALKREFLAVTASTAGERWAGLGALPVLGAFARRWGWLKAAKAKAAAWTSALPPIAAPVVGVAVAVGSVVGVGVTALPDGDSGAQPAPVVEVIDTSASTASETLPGTNVAAPGDAATTAFAGPAPGAPAEVARPGQTFAALPTGTSVRDADGASAEANSPPVEQSVTLGDDRVIVGINPALIAKDLNDTFVPHS